MDLSRSAVFLDFDGTISVRDTGEHLLERVGTGGWRDLDRRFTAGEIGSRECIVAQLACLPRDETLLRRVAAEVPVDPGFAPLVSGLRAAGAEVTVVSDGFGFHVADRCAGVDVLTNAVDFASWTVSFPFRARGDCPCDRCGTCKRAPIEQARARGLRTVMIGDGPSDREAVAAADVVFAKESLAAWCTEQGISYLAYERLDDVAAVLLDGAG